MLDAYPISDGFTLRIDILPDLEFNSMVLGEYEHLRRSSRLQGKVWAIPGDPVSALVPSWDSYDEQLSIKPGSVIWGWSFPGPSLSNPYSFQIVDVGSGEEMFSEPVSVTNPGLPSQQNQFAKPLVVSPPGLLNITICNQGPANVGGIQLILWGGEPQDIPCGGE
jgi:hypothetical protein